MATSVTMPQLGESVTEGTVTRWLKQVGDSVAVDEPLLEVSTDKVDTEIPSPVAGVITVGVALWLVYGWLTAAWPVVFANAITLTLASFILVMKLRFR